MSLAFSEYMHKCLYDPDNGYYMQKQNPVGSHGDFITAPEISPALAYACASAFIKLASSEPNLILCEVGPGSGKLMLEVIKYLVEQDCLPEQVWMVELNQNRIEQQQSLLSGLPTEISKRIIWHKVMPKHKWQGLIIANELLDAIPFDIVRKNNSIWTELRVRQEGGQYSFYESCLRPELQKFLPKVDVPDMYQTEIFPLLPGFLNSLTCNMDRGALLFIDYGYPHQEFYHPQRVLGTSKVFLSQKSSNDLLLLPGECDITAHVDFSLLKLCLQELGISTRAFMTQSQFLICTKSYEQLSSLDELGYDKACNAFKSLFFEMGDIFKVLLAEKMSDAWLSWLNNYGVDRL